MPAVQNNEEVSKYHGFIGALKKSIRSHGILRWLLALPLLFIYCVSYSLMSPYYKNVFRAGYDELEAEMNAEKSAITSPASLSRDLFYYSGIWEDLEGENPFVDDLMTGSMEYLFKSVNFLREIQDKDETSLRQMIRDRLRRAGSRKSALHTEEEIYASIKSRGEYFSRLFDQLFSQHGLKKLETEYTDTDVEVFFNMLCTGPDERKFRRILGALVLNVPYYLVIKNSVNEYYQQSDILFPVDLFSFTLFMMYLDEVKKSGIKPSIEDCRKWVFSVIVPDDKTRDELQSYKFHVQPVNREEMIMPNPGYFSKAYNEKRHKAVDIASERGTMIRSPLTGTVTYYDQSRKKARTGNYIIIKDESSHFSIFICHMDNKDYIESHSTEGGLAEPIANLTPDWVHPLKKGQFFHVVGNTGKSTGAHTHMQVALNIPPYTTYDFLAVNKPFRKQFYEYLYRGNYWNVYSRNEQLFLSVFGMVAGRYDSTRHFTDRDPAVLEFYRDLQEKYVPVCATVTSTDIELEVVPDQILKKYFPGTIQEKAINERYTGLLEYFAVLAAYYDYLLNLQVPQAPDLPSRAVPLTPWMVFSRRRDEEDTVTAGKSAHDKLFYAAVNRYFLYRMLQLNNTPREMRESMLSDPAFSGIIPADFPHVPAEYEGPGVDERIRRLAENVREITDSEVDTGFINEDDFCSLVFEDIMTVCRSEGMPLDSNFGFYRYRMSELQNSYRTSRFIRFPDTREFRYNRKYDDAVRSFFLDIFELAAEHKNYYLFRRLYFNHDELSLNILRRFSRGISRLYKKAVCRIRLRFMHVPYPAVKRIYPVHLHSVFHGIIRDIIKPLSFESRTYAESVYYRAAETSLFYSLVYEVYLNEREHYMKLFPAEQLSHVLDAIGLFDSMFKVFCDNTARKQLIDNEHARITGELEAMEKELESLKNSRRELRDDFRNRTAELTLPGEYVSRHSELFTTYITEEEKISRTVASMEHSLERYREECGILKKEKDLLRIQYGEKLEKMYREVEELKSKSILEQQRFRSEIKKMTYDKGKSDLEIIDLRAEITHLKHEIESMTNQYSMTAQKAEGSSGELKKLREKYEKVLAELSGIQKKFNDMTNMLREGLGPYAKDFSSEELNKETRNLLKSSETYRDASAAVKLLQEQQKNDKRSLMLNANLISRLKEQVDKLEVQLQYLRDTTSSDREKELEEENERLADIIRKSGL